MQSPWPIIPLRLLRASSQPRPLQTSEVTKLADSIRVLGLIQPITVQAVPILNALAEPGFQIVAGHHRVAAVRSLGWTEIAATVVQVETPLQAELLEIDENLCRAELSPAQRAYYTARRAEICQALQPQIAPETLSPQTEEAESGTICSTLASPELHPTPKTGRGNIQFAAETAALTGQSKQEINRQRSRGQALGNDALRVVGTSLDKGVELDALLKLPVPERKGLIDKAVAGEKVSARRLVPNPTKTTPSVAEDDPISYCATELIELFERLRGRFSCNDNRELLMLLWCHSETASAKTFAAYDAAISELFTFRSLLSLANMTQQVFKSKPGE